jgi:hypothetical protein
MQDNFLKMRVLGQFNNGFIIAALDSDLFILDQHACDEKVQFETLQRTTTIHNQRLIMCVRRLCVPVAGLLCTAYHECCLVCLQPATAGHNCGTGAGDHERPGDLRRKRLPLRR